VSLVVGIDLGTQSLKAVICDPAAGFAVLGAHAIAQTTAYPSPGCAEQDPRAWEAALAPAIAGALANAGRTPRDVAALAITGQLDGCVAVDRRGAPLAPALIWQDRRASVELDAALATASMSRHALFVRTGQVADPSHLGAKARWFDQHGFHAARFHLPVSYLVDRLTGAAVVDFAHASTTMLLGLDEQAWSPVLLDLFGVAIDRLPAIAAPTARAGSLHAIGAALTGLPFGTPVAVGTGDDFATPLGAGIASPGGAFCTLGTAEVVGGLARQAICDHTYLRDARDPWRELDEPMVETHPFPAGGFLLENPGWLSGGAVELAARWLGVSSGSELDALAMTSPPGARGLTFVPHLAGAMTPRWRPDARGSFVGLSAAHERGDLARAVLEGLACASRDVIERLAGLGVSAHVVHVLGGGGASRFWVQLRADLLGRPHHIAARRDTAAVGAAMIAAVAIGAATDLPAAAACAIDEPFVVEPRGESGEAYDRYREVVARELVPRP